MDETPVPDATDEDVTRIVRRDFPPAAHADVLAALGRYGDEPWQVAPPRVRLAILKLAAGNLERLRSQVAVACQDYRDVITPAEYPAYSQHPPDEPFTPDEKACLHAANSAQYTAWLHHKGAAPEP